MQNLNGNLLVSLDLETTGLTAGYHEIYQVGAVAITPDLEVDKSVIPLDLWMRPEYIDRLDPESMRLTKGNFLDKISLAVSQERGIDLWEHWVTKHLKLPKGKKIMLIGQNIAQHDIPFLRNWLGNHYYNETFHHHVRDTMITAIHLNDVADWCREVFPFPRVGLRDLANKLGIECPEKAQHEAVFDCTLTAQIYKCQVRHYLNEMRKGTNDSNGQGDKAGNGEGDDKDIGLQQQTPQPQ